jgi:hypothetical protein
MKNFAAKRGLRNKKAIEPVISTVIITGTIIALVTVATIFANNLLSARVAESDFASAKQFMQTIGLQIDDVAWKIGQTETIRYSSRYGTINSLNAPLTYTINVTTTSGATKLFSQNSTGIIYFYMPISYYSISNNYFSQVWPSQVSTLTTRGSSAPVAKVFAVEKIPMFDGNYIRIVTAPTIRVINSTIITATNSTFYFKLYLPLLSLKSSPMLSQSVTLTGNSILVKTENSIKSIGVSVSFPKASSGFDNTFFHFPLITEVLNAPSGYTNCVAEFYTGAVAVSIGANV